jgi:hypothetical protein
MMERSWEAAAEFVPSYGGILPVFMDNCYYPSGNGKANAVTTNKDYFLAGPFDTGNSDQKYAYFIRYSGTATYIRMFNDLTATSVDVWALGNGSGNRTTNAPGRYYIVPVKKSIAADFFMYTKGTGDSKVYHCKGTNVSD